MKIDAKPANKTIFIKNFIGGLGWMLGATIGFALLLAILSLVSRWLGGLPLVGSLIANLIEIISKALEIKGNL